MTTFCIKGLEEKLLPNESLVQSTPAKMQLRGPENYPESMLTVCRFNIPTTLAKLLLIANVPFIMRNARLTFVLALKRTQLAPKAKQLQQSFAGLRPDMWTAQGHSWQHARTDFVTSDSRPLSNVSACHKLWEAHPPILQLKSHSWEWSVGWGRVCAIFVHFSFTLF